MSCCFGLQYVLFVFLLIVILVISHFDFECGTLALISSVPRHCLSFTSYDARTKQVKSNYHNISSTFDSNLESLHLCKETCGIDIR